MKRREAIEHMIRASFGAAGLSLMTGCRSFLNQSTLKDDGTIKMQDLLILRLDYKTGTEVVDKATEQRIVLPASYIRDDKIFEFVWREKTHEHTILVDHSHYLDLVHGDPAVVISAFVNNHDHQFVIAPKIVDENSPETEISLAKYPKIKTDAIPMTPEHRLFNQR